MSGMKRLLITGAAGNLGGQMRGRLGHLAETLRLADRGGMGAAGPNEEIFQCDLGDRAAVEEMVAGCDGVVHFGGQPVEDVWEVVRNANIDGMYNLYEASRKHGVRRLVFASSNHAVGFHEQDRVIDNTVIPRPDGLYGLSKVFGEALASMYWDKFGIETACVRIGYSFAEPDNHRTMRTYLSFDDLARLIERVFKVPRLGCPIIYGVSDNEGVLWDNSKVAYIGWRPKDSSEPWRARIERDVEMPDKDAPVARFHGGAFTADGIHGED